VGLQLLDEIQALPDPLDDLIGLAAAIQAGTEAAAQDLLHECGTKADTDDAAQRAEEIRAGGSDGLILGVDVSDDADQGGGDGGADSQGGEAEADDQTPGELEDAGREEDDDAPEDREREAAYREPVVFACSLHDDPAEEGAADARDEGGDHSGTGRGGGEVVNDLVDMESILLLNIGSVL